MVATPVGRRAVANDFAFSGSQRVIDDLSYFIDFKIFRMNFVLDIGRSIMMPYASDGTMIGSHVFRRLLELLIK